MSEPLDGIVSEYLLEIAGILHRITTNTTLDRSDVATLKAAGLIEPDGRYINTVPADERHARHLAQLATRADRIRAVPDPEATA